MPEPLVPSDNPSDDQTNLETNQITDTSRIEALIQQSLGESERNRLAAEQRARALEDELRELRNSRNNTPVQDTPVVDSNEFFQNPQANISRLIAEQNKPVLELAKQMQRERDWNSFKSEYRNQMPGFNLIENIVDSIMSKKEISHANMQSAIFEATGRLVASGGLQNNNNNNQAPTPKKDEEIEDPANLNANNPAPKNPSAHIRPSARHSQSNTEKVPKRRELSEHEKRIIRETPGMTEDKYFKLLEASPKVTDWKEKGGK